MMPGDVQTLPDGVLDALDVGVIVLDPDRRILVWNRWLEQAAGLAARDALGRKLDALFHGVAESRLPEAVEDALDSGISSVLTHTLNPDLLPLRTDAGLRMLHNLVVRAVSCQGRNCCLVQVNDVTAIAERDRILRDRQNARYRAVVDTAPDAMVTTTKDGLVQWMNAAAEREFGYAAQEVIGRDVGLLFDQAIDWPALCGDGTGPQPCARSVEIVGRRKDGSTVDLELSTGQWTSGGRVFVTAILRDISDRQKAEAALMHMNETLEERVAERTSALRLSEARVRTLLDSTFQLIGLLAPDGTLLEANRASLDVIGCTLQDIIGLPVWETPWFSATPDVAAEVKASVPAAAAGNTVQTEVTLNLPDGSVRTYDFSLRPMRDEAGQVVALVPEARDVTELRAAEEALRQAQKMEAVGQLTGGVAHDFNNLLQIVTGNLDILNRNLPQDAGRLRRSVENALTGARRAAILTQRLLAFSRRQPLAPKPVKINALISGMSDLLMRALGETIQLETVLAGGLWPVEADPNQLENAILNLAVNARDAMPDGGKLTIETANTYLDATYAQQNAEVTPGQYVAICVSDTGCGMDEATKSRVFEPFFTTKEVGKGTGLGLSQVYGFVKQSGGHVKIYSEPGEGTTVEIYLPRLLGLQADEEAAAEQIVPEGSDSETILVVEDDDDVRAYAVDVLRELGYRVLEAHDGPSALRLIEGQAQPIDLLFTDVVLPGGMNGEQLARQARALRPEVRVLFTTGYARDAIVHHGRLDAGVELITKPFTLADLAAKVRAVLDGRG